MRAWRWTDAAGAAIHALARRYAKCTEPKPFVPSAPINAGHELPESRMKGNFHVRFGGGRLEKGQQCHLASRLPNTEWDRSASTVLLPDDY